jgi:pimeloyl-ACP methyl ester carboxylesterase
VTGVPATELWFGPTERPLFGWLHAPAAGARAGVVLCPPLGRDYLQAHYALRRLAERLEARGFAVLRFDYDGTGDSAGARDDPGRVEAWLESVAVAAQVLRTSGVRRIAMCGMRLGATLAGVAALRDGSVDRLVLWDPYPSGKAFLSEQRALAALTFGIAPTLEDGSIETPGAVYDAGTVAALRKLDVANSPGRLPAAVLVLSRTDRPIDERLRVRLSASRVDWSEATGQPELMDRGSPYQELPDAAIDRVVGWFSSEFDEVADRMHLPATSHAARVGEGPDGLPILETLSRFGPVGLFGISTEVPRRDAVSGPVVLLLSVANEHHIGPNRLWVDFARAWALAGMRVLRFDLSGLGDSPARPGQAEFVSRAPEAFDDVVDVARAVSPDDPSDVLLVGLCSAAYQAIESALELAPKGIVCVNPVLSFQPPEMLTSGRVSERRRACLPRRPLVEAFHAEGRLSALRRRYPDLAWRVRNIAAGSRRPAVWARGLSELGVDALFVCGDRETRQIRLGMSSRTFGRLERTERFRFESIPGLDHGLLLSSHRELVSRMVATHVIQRFGPVASERVEARAHAEGVVP